VLSSHVEKVVPPLQQEQGLSAEEHDAYSRQIAAYGVEMMMRLKSLDVLLVGLQGPFPLPSTPLFLLLIFYLLFVFQTIS